MANIQNSLVDRGRRLPTVKEVSGEEGDRGSCYVFTKS